MQRPAIFLDRDGTINEQMGYINHPSRFILLPGAAEAIHVLNQNKYLVIITSNQSGVARGYFPIQLVDKIHEKMILSLAKEDAFIDKIYYCPHHTGGTVAEYSIKCDCRKPGPGLINKALKDFDIDIDHSYVIGDRCSDIAFAQRANIKGIMVETGYGLGDAQYILPDFSHKPIHIAKDLLEAVNWICKGNKKTGNAQDV